MLTTEQLRLRDGRLTASRVSCLMTGDAEKILNLWREMVGDPAFVPEDLSGVWAVQLGTATEAVNLEFYTRQTGRALSRHGEVAICPGADWAACTLDAWDDVMAGPVDAKHVGGYEPREKVRERYTPQMTWQMICTGARWSALSIVEGAKAPVIEEVPWDEAYAAELWRRAEAFVACVQSLTPPVEMAPVAAPVVPVKEYDMSTSNAWAEHAAVWAEYRDAAKKFGGAEKELKALVPADGIRCHGYGIEIKRDKAGRLGIKKL